MALGELDELIREILQYPWDYPEELVWLTPGDAVAVLQRSWPATLSATECERWADGLEGRDELGFQEDAEDVLADFIFELATPGLTQPLSAEGAGKWIARH